MSWQLMRVSSNIPRLHARFISTTSKLRSTLALDKAEEEGSAVVTDKVDASKINHEAWYPKIGNRQVVGYGLNGQACYVDRPDYPYPAVTFLETTPDYLALKEKEKGDWKNLTVAEIKQLYRVNYCQTFAEFTTPTGEWKEEWAFFMWGMLLTLILEWFFVHYVYTPLPKTTNQEWQMATIDNQIKRHHRAIEGYGYFPTKIWDYEKEEWKK